MSLGHQRFSLQLNGVEVIFVIKTVCCTHCIVIIDWTMDNATATATTTTSKIKLERNRQLNLSSNSSSSRSSIVHCPIYGDSAVCTTNSFNNENHFNSM